MHWGACFLFLHHQRKATAGARRRHQRKGLVIHLVVGQSHRRRPVNFAIATPLPKTGVDLGAAALTDPICQHDARVEPWVTFAARRPEVIEVQRLQLLAPKGPGHDLALVPALGLGIPLGLQDGPVVRQEGVGSAVGVVDDLDAAGVGQDGARLGRDSQRGRGGLLRMCSHHGGLPLFFVPTEWGEWLCASGLALPRGGVPLAGWFLGRCG